MHADHIGHKSLLAKMYPPGCTRQPTLADADARLGVVLRWSKILMPRRSRSQRDQPAKEESSRAQRDHELNVTINDLDYPQPAEKKSAR